MRKFITVAALIIAFAMLITSCTPQSALPEEMRPKDDAWYASLSHEEHVKAYEDKGLSRMDAIKAAAKDLGVAKSVLYKELQSN